MTNLIYSVIEVINAVFNTIFIVVQSFHVFGFVVEVEGWSYHLVVAKIMKEMVIQFSSRLPLK